MCRDLADNRVFFQHPDLIRLLGIHETVMQLMVNTLNKAQQESAATETTMSAIDSQKRSSSMSQLPNEAAAAEPAKVDEPIRIQLEGRSVDRIRPPPTLTLTFQNLITVSPVTKGMTDEVW